ncbi:uncharacterized protein FOMMEDRAFT_77495 [Fomitiporia mediterranea MF3/22]|uniref:uncharacterized protein n=1 Tax=Fomitiporia mediterranea (strain MF3/22) TaxID=694068 RepID=UPI0004409A5F|nr:uncharacterized protein FOMMEDRAFT_77495 [Fomitiporia mediterranea MF3/22]EJD05944.1 hypothetical protein FOMMEDRAFT_77495 [Fomitiporia mediterranea MF3/22]
MRLITIASVLSAASFAWAFPTSTSSAAAAAGSQIRTDQDPVYHFYIQSTPVDGAPVLGPESSSGWFNIGSTVQDTNSSLFLNVDMSATTSYKPLTLDDTATTTTWSMSGDTIIASGQQNFVVCPSDNSSLLNFFLQTGNDMPSSTCTDWITIHLPCLC